MHILIAINTSAQIVEVLRFSAQLVQGAGATPTLLVAAESRQSHALHPLDQLLENAREILGIQNLEIRVRNGRPAEEIVSEAHQGGYDLVILGDYQAHQPARVCPKTVAGRVAQSAPCSVLVVKGNARSFRRILLCDSGAGQVSAFNGFTARFVRSLGVGANTTVLHVMSQISAGPGVRGRQLRSDADALIHEHTPEGDLLQKDVRALEQSGLHPEPRVRHGLVVDEILAEARIGDYDLVVIGAHQRAGWQAFLLEDLSNKIIMGLDRPVLVIRFARK